jgi:hypothetical protein
LAFPAANYNAGVAVRNPVVPFYQLDRLYPTTTANPLLLPRPVALDKLEARNDNFSTLKE